MDSSKPNTRLLKHCIASALIAGGLLCPARAFAQTNSDFDRGMAEFRAGNYAASAAMFARAESAAPGSTDALLYQAKSQVHLQDFPAAERALRAYCASHHDSSDGLYLLGFVLHRENRPAQSLDTYTRAAAITPPTADDLKVVGLNYVLLDDYPDAIKWLEKAVERDAKNKDAIYYLGRAYYTKARLAEARKAFLSILDMDPRDSRAENNLGLILETEGQPAAAIETYRKAITWQEDTMLSSEQPYVNLGNLLLEQGQTMEAAAPLEKAAALSPNNAYCRLKLGVYYRTIGNLRDAERELETATRLDPDNATAHYQLGRVYKDMHQLDRAKAEFDRTAELQKRASGPRSNPKSE